MINNVSSILPKIKCKSVVSVFIVILLLFSGNAYAQRLKDLASIAGVRSNQLVGYGLVVGLNGTGDQTTQAPFTTQSLKSMLSQFGITVPDNVNPQLKNVAAVSIHAELPAFTKPGQTIDITISSIANSKSLRGGSLLMAPLKGADGKVYAIAQGNVVVGGFGVGADGSSITVNIPSVGRIPNGAMVERGVTSGFMQGNFLTFNLHTPDFTTANRVANVINKSIGEGTAEAVDGSSIKVNAPRDPSQRVAFTSLVENFDITPAEGSAKIVVNSRTGTIIIGQHVRVMPAAITHGSLTVTISAKPVVSQPAPLSDGETVVVPRTELAINEEASPMFLFEPGVSLSDIVRAINEVGATPSDLIAILEALKQSGALKANLLVI
ncbi:MAG: flagellar basal body P-ring protein FlgI [Ectothiorhodospiraceae bacterium]|nr:flagellar basal body P-ring protein FlgI [Ectothiorhodospiraceae bacterium]